MTAREDILARIRTAVAAAPAAGARPPRGARPAKADLVELLVDRLRDYKATVHVVDPDDLPATIAAVLGTRRILAPPGLPGTWLVDSVPWVREPTDLDAVDGVLTASALAIAETGTLVLDAGPGQGRRAATLVPDYHLCVVDLVVESVGEALARVDPVRPLTWISGPSATSDIELSRVEGVHGPRTLEVIVLRPTREIPPIRE